MKTIYHRRCATRAEAKAVLFAYIEAFHNRTKLHSSLGYVSPVTFEIPLNKITSRLLSEILGETQGSKATLTNRAKER
jgi:hypothetical protein